jgi:MFS family permease
VAYAATFPALSILGIDGISNPQAPWRYTLMTGVIPAIPLILIRPFLPESPVWKERRAAGTLKRPSIAAIFSPQLRRTTILTTLMVAMSYAAAFGAIQQFPQMIPGLLRGAEPTAIQGATTGIQGTQEIGGLIGRFLLAVLAVRIVSRRSLIRVFQIPGLVAMPIVFAFIATTSLDWLYFGAFVVGLLTVGQFSFWGNYLPRMYPVHLRGTGESFAMNIGGRLIGTSFAWLTLTLATTTDRAYAPTKIALVAAAVGFSVYLIGFIASFWLPEPKQEDLPD